MDQQVIAGSIEEGCQDEEVMRSVERSVFLSKHPKGCVECMGTGYVTLNRGTETETFEPCPDCVEQGLCPMCGEKMGWHGRYVDVWACSACGWKDPS